MDRSISEYAIEVISTRFDRVNHRAMIALIITIALLFASNAAWLWAWVQYDYESSVTETVTVDGEDGVASYANNGGSVINGESYSGQDNATAQTEKRFQGD